MLKADETLEGYRAGDTLVYRLTITDSDGALFDDAGVNIETKDPLENIGNTVLEDDELVNISTGIYDMTLVLNQVGDWYFEFRLTAGQSYLLYVPTSASINVSSIGALVTGFDSGFSKGFGA